MLLNTFFALLQITVAAEDNGPVQRSARKAQLRFESIRRANLPFNRSGGISSSNCSALIGRYCYFYDSTESRVVPEPKRITSARTRLLQGLDSAAAVQPADAWIVGQRVRYLLEAAFVDDTSPDSAIAVARRCVATNWWCDALEGMTLHVAERYREADSVFALALDSMPSSQRCEWHDLRDVIAGALAKEFAAASCTDRERLASRLWKLSQPLWSVSGNDARTEHYARHTMALILDGSANAHGLPWSDDSRELLVRYGWAEWFTQRREDIIGLHTGPHVTGHDREPSYHFFPDVRALRDLPWVADDVWHLRDPLARSRYAPRHVKRIVDLPHQLTRFPRGDSMLVRVAFDVTDSVMTREPITAQLCDSLRCVTTDARRSVSVVVPRDTMIASVEVRGDSSKRTARARYSISPLACVQQRCLSDLLLFDATNTTEASDLATISANALTNFAISSRLPLGVYWELEHERVTADPLWVSVTVSPVRVSLVRRVATRLHLAQPATPISLRWQAASSASIQPRHVTLKLPANARGRYRVTLTIQSPDGPTLVATRDIDLKS